MCPVHDCIRRVYSCKFVELRTLAKEAASDESAAAICCVLCFLVNLSCVDFSPKNRCEIGLKRTQGLPSLSVLPGPRDLTQSSRTTLRWASGTQHRCPCAEVWPSYRRCRFVECLSTYFQELGKVLGLLLHLTRVKICGKTLKAFLPCTAAYMWLCVNTRAT